LTMQHKRTDKTMSLKTIRDSYDKLLTTLNEAGIKFDAS